VLYDLTKTNPTANYDIDNGLVVYIGEISSRLLTVSDRNLTFATRGGKIKATYDYASEYLREYSASEDGFVALLLNRYQSGSVGRLVTVDDEGKECASLDVNEEILSISASGGYVAVLYADRLVIYNKDLEEYSSMSGTDYAKSVLIRSDGSALLISSDKARPYLP
jgi:hypothetical protein